MIIKVKAKLKDVPVVLLPECPQSVRSFLKNYHYEYASITTFRNFLKNKNFTSTKPQSKGLIKFLALLLFEPLDKEILKLKINSNNPKEKLIGLKYKLIEL